MFIKSTRANKSQILPFWSEKVNTGKWQKIKILLYHESGFNQVSLFFKSGHARFDFGQPISIDSHSDITSNMFDTQEKFA